MANQPIPGDVAAPDLSGLPPPAVGSHHPPSLGRRVVLLGMFALAMAGLVFGVHAITSNKEQNAKLAISWVEHTHEVIAAMHGVLESAEDAETGQRGFLLTGDGRYLEPYRRGTDAIPQDLSRVRTLIADNPAQQDRLRHLEDLLRHRQAELERTITLAQSGDIKDAVEIVRTDEGRHLMDDVRLMAADMVAEEQRLLQERRATQQRLQHETERMLGALLIAAAIAMVLGGAGLARSFRSATAARSAEALAAERQRLLDMMNLAAIMVRDLDGTIRFWSQGCVKLFGWTAEQAIGQSSHALLKTIFPAPLADIKAALLRDGEWSGELRHFMRNGAEVVVAVRKVIRRQADGSLAIMENVTDITALRQAETALRESQAELRSIVDTAAEGIVVAHADGRITAVNRAALRMFGYDAAEELIGRDLGMLMPGVDAARHRAYVAAHRSGSPPRVIDVPGRELMALRRDGSEFPIDLSVSSFGTNSHRCLTGIIRDATARKQAEAELRTSEARLRLVQQVGGIAYTDQSTTTTTSLISEEYARLYDLPPGKQEITRAEWLALLHPEDRARLQAETDSLFVHGGSLASDFRVCWRDGSVHWIAMRVEVFPGPDGRPVRMISAQQDVTEIVAAREAQESRAAELERRVAERTAALAEAEARFRAIFDSQFQFIGLLDANGILLEANRTALGAAGLTPKDTIGRPFWETGWWPEADRDRLRQEIAQAARGAVIRHEAKNIGTGKRTIWIDFSLKPVRDATTNEVVWIIAEGRDITEQRSLSAQLVQAQKVQALGQLASGIAHDFNNILQAVEGAATLIERRPEDSDKTRRLARMAINAAARGGSITQRLLSFARRDDLRIEALPTAKLLANIREVLAHTLGTGIVVQSVVSEDIPPLLADRGQLETALVNLGTNARDAMPNGGRLTLAAEAEHATAAADHPAGLKAGDYIRLSISDTGTGMDAATLAQATEAFFTTKPPGQGTGLGLPMVKAFAEQSGGAMAIASTPGAGTTITLWLRQAADQRAEAAGTAQDRRRMLEGPARVLLVDDDDMVREMLAAQLEDLGFDTLVASGGAEAVALLEAGEKVDALISDLSMPDMDGVTTIGKARAVRPQLPCFLLTGYVGERAALSAGNTFTLVRKPISAQALAAHIEAGIEAAARSSRILSEHGRSQ